MLEFGLQRYNLCILDSSLSFRWLVVRFTKKVTIVVNSDTKATYESDLPSKIRVQFNFHCIRSFPHPFFIMVLFPDLMLALIDLPRELHPSLEFVKKIEFD